MFNLWGLLVVAFLLFKFYWLLWVIFLLRFLAIFVLCKTRLISFVMSEAAIEMELTC